MLRTVVIHSKRIAEVTVCCSELLLFMTNVLLRAHFCNNNCICLHALATSMNKSRARICIVASSPKTSATRQRYFAQLYCWLAATVSTRLFGCTCLVGSRRARCARLFAARVPGARRVARSMRHAACGPKAPGWVGDGPRMRASLRCHAEKWCGQLMCFGPQRIAYGTGRR